METWYIIKDASAANRGYYKDHSMHLPKTGITFNENLYRARKFAIATHADDLIKKFGWDWAEVIAADFDKFGNPLLP